MVYCKNCKNKSFNWFGEYEDECKVPNFHGSTTHRRSVKNRDGQCDMYKPKEGLLTILFGKNEDKNKT